MTNRFNENKIKYLKQRNSCISLLTKIKKSYYSNLNEKKVADNKTFWKAVKPFLSDKTPFDEKITLMEKEKIIKTDTKTANVLNTSFSVNKNEFQSFLKLVDVIPVFKKELKKFRTQLPANKYLKNHF